ncbi:MAG: OprO/OprP family phosphate-selective porin [Polymorphobacter sp.]|uniref:OprO/OprP family phosphate-selective porin n=1 Tax=Polymorphobacter sp. TaxID=1909290 RepID=UPI003A89E2B5
MPNLLRDGWRDMRYAVPDLAPDLILIPRVNTRVLTIRPGIELIIDRTGFGQDDASLAQVGLQENLLEVRSATFDLNGEVGFNRRFEYQVGVAFNGFDNATDQRFAVTDFNVAFQIPKWRTRVRLGQLREDFGFEIVGSTSTMPQSERILGPFASPFNFGFKVTHQLGEGERATLTYGIFKDDWGDDGSGNAALSARLTLLAIDEPDRRLHLGVAVRQADVRDTIRYNGRPGVSAADDFVDTGEFPAASTTHIGLEAHYAHGPWAVVAEYATARPDVANGPDPQFHGYYVLGSWVLTGEQRAYDRAKGTVKRIIPEGRWGAPELVARYAAVDLSSGGIDGGRYDRIEVGANWWATTRWKFGVLYGHVWLKRDGETGHTQSLLTRLQWIY